jgi:hypothetical protein
LAAVAAGFAACFSGLGLIGFETSPTATSSLLLSSELLPSFLSATCAAGFAHAALAAGFSFSSLPSSLGEGSSSLAAAFGAGLAAVLLLL